jgi:hypothetical protein
MKEDLQSAVDSTAKTHDFGRSTSSIQTGGQRGCSYIGAPMVAVFGIALAFVLTVTSGTVYIAIAFGLTVLVFVVGRALDNLWGMAAAAVIIAVHIPAFANPDVTEFYSYAAAAIVAMASLGIAAMILFGSGAVGHIELYQRGIVVARRTILGRVNILLASEWRDIRLDSDDITVELVHRKDGTKLGYLKDDLSPEFINKIVEAIDKGVSAPDTHQEGV